MASTKKKAPIASSSASTSGPHLSLEKICNTLKIASSDVVYAFLLGSRLWGTSNELSDYDVYLVIRNNAGFASHLSSQKSFASIHSANIDGLVMVESEYLSTYHRIEGLSERFLTNSYFASVARIKDSAVFDLITLWVPGEFIVKSGAIHSWNRDLVALEASVEKVRKRDLLMAQKHAENGKPSKTKKVLTHLIRMIMMATQIVELGRITDFECANEIFATLQQSYHLSSWESFEEEVVPIQEAEYAKFKESLSRQNR